MNAESRKMRELMELDRYSFVIIILIALYVLSPIDLISGCPIDDLAAIVLGVFANRSSNG